MPAGWRPSVLRTSTLRWLLDLTWCGHVYRLAEQPVSAPTGEAGASEQYAGGLEFGGEYDDVLALFGEEGEQAVSLTLHLDGLVDVPAQIAAGWALQAATGRPLVWPDGGAAQDVVVVLVGVVREPTYGAATEPVTLTLSEEEDEADGRIPALRAVFDAATWPAGAGGDEDLFGELYPIILGRPGVGVGWGSAAIAVTSGRLLIAGHPIAATTVDVLDEFPSPGPTQDNAAPVTTLADGEGRVIASCSTFVNIITPLVIGDSYWIRWSGAGGLTRGGVEVRGAGAVLRWLLQESGARTDFGRVDAAADYPAPKS